MWHYNGEPWQPDEQELKRYVGFVYLITDTSNDMKYVGKKLLWSKRKLPPLKGKTRKRVKVVESNWRDYYGSSEYLNELVAESGPERFYREILHLCEGRGDMSYLELKEQVDREVLLRPDEYYNGIIQVRIHRNHVKNLS